MWSAEARRGILDMAVAFESHWNTWIGLAAQAGDLGLCLHSSSTKWTLPRTALMDVWTQVPRQQQGQPQH